MVKTTQEACFKVNYSKRYRLSGAYDPRIIIVLTTRITITSTPHTPQPAARAEGVVGVGRTGSAEVNESGNSLEINEAPRRSMSATLTLVGIFGGK